MSEIKGKSIKHDSLNFHKKLYNRVYSVLKFSKKGFVFREAFCEQTFSRFVLPMMTSVLSCSTAYEWMSP